MGPDRRKLFGSANELYCGEVCSLELLHLRYSMEVLSNNIFLASRGYSRLHMLHPQSWRLLCAYYSCSSPLTKHLTKANRRDYWGYFEPIREHMPQNCSSDVEAVIAYIDATFESGNKQEIAAIEKTFNMSLSHLDDFAGACMCSFILPFLCNPSMRYGQYERICGIGKVCLQILVQTSFSSSSATHWK